MVPEAQVGEEMHKLASRLFPICRSITGSGVRETLTMLQEYVPLTLNEVPSGTPVFDWIVPREWNIRDAYILDPQGNKIVDFKRNNLHIVSYSVPIDVELSLAELQKHLYSLPEQPDAIPYVTSYYEEQWGFCLTHTERTKLKNGSYRVVIDSDLKNGSLTYGELIIPGQTEKEIFISTYICHPSMANNELSGPVVTTFLAQWLARMPRRYTYRIVFIPETIGSITYLSSHADAMKRNTIAGFNMTCMGDERAYSFLPSRAGNSLSDRVARTVLSHRHPEYVEYSFLERGSDERQYCSPGVDLPIVSIMRSKYNTFPEYHTSLDNLTFVTAEGLRSSYETMKDCLLLIEQNYFYQATNLGEPQMGRRGLYPTLGGKVPEGQVRMMMHILAYADGSNDVASLSSIIGVAPWELYPALGTLRSAGLIRG